MKLSDFGNKIQGSPNLQRLMKDMRSDDSGKPLIAMFGGGNPAQIPAVADRFLEVLRELVSDKTATEDMLGSYDSPQGNMQFIRSVRDFMNRHYNLGISDENIAIAPGSQTGYFLLFNILAGRTGSTRRKILFPLVPEYTGYVDQSIDTDIFTEFRPTIHKIGEREFEYKIDFNSLHISDNIAALVISRPTNPTGNVVTDDEIEKLGELAKEHDIPLIIDSAYGLPFPDIVAPKIKLFWNDHTVFSMSLSKIGLPSLRTGIFIGPRDLIEVFTQADAIVNLASPSFGQYLAKPFFDNDEILRLSKKLIRPYYFERAEKARRMIYEQFPKELPWRLHAYQGSYFFWLWLEGSKMSSQQLHDWLKDRGVITVSGEQFFLPQDAANWRHAHECLRINFARPDHELEAGIPILAEAIKVAYK